VVFRLITLTKLSICLKFFVGNITKATCNWQYVNSPLHPNTDATLSCKIKHFLYSYFTPHQNKQKCRKIVFFPVAALVVSNSDKTCYQPTFESTTLLQMYSYPDANAGCRNDAAC